VVIGLWLKAAAAAAQAKFDDDLQDEVRWGGRSLLLLLLLVLLLLGRDSRLMHVIWPKYDEGACGAMAGHIQRKIFRRRRVQQQVT
jgi:hypothetical protein